MRTKYIFAAGLLVGLAFGPWSFVLGGQTPDNLPRAGLRERISDLYLLRLTRALDLTEDQTARIYPLLTRAEKDKAALQRQMGLDLRDLRAELTKTPPGEEAVLARVDRIRQARRAIRQKDEQVEAVLDGILTPVQRARYLVFTVEFLRNVGENLGRARGARTAVKRTP
jgi:hypothetical protein